MNNRISRRSMIRQAATGGMAAVSATAMGSTAFAAERTRKFTIDLVGGAIGVEASPAELIRLAVKHGFESVQPNSRYLGQLTDQQLAELRSQMKTDGLVWGAAGMPVEFRGDQPTFENHLKNLPKAVASYQRAGVTRISTYLKPFHEKLTYNQNFKQHATRLKSIAKIAGDGGLRFGLEYVGTKTLWTRSRFAFIHTMQETKELLAAIDEPNVGFVLDSWHWYCAGETKDDLLTLRNKDIVACDLNDAPKGVAVDEQLDYERELPAATGVIDLKTFLSALVEIGYDGPIRAEPFNQPLNELDNDDACAATSKAIAKAFTFVGG